jgi:hypothetical protein
MRQKGRNFAQSGHTVLPFKLPNCVNCRRGFFRGNWDQFDKAFLTFVVAAKNSICNVRRTAVEFMVAVEASKPFSDHFLSILKKVFFKKKL